jgi:hypothetical protein
MKVGTGEMVVLRAYPTLHTIQKPPMFGFTVIFHPSTHTVLDNVQAKSFAWLS